MTVEWHWFLENPPQKSGMYLVHMYCPIRNKNFVVSLKYFKNANGKTLQWATRNGFSGKNVIHWAELPECPNFEIHSYENKLHKKIEKYKRLKLIELNK